MSSAVRTSQRHAITHAVVALPTDTLRSHRSMDAYLILAQTQLAREQGIVVDVTQRVVCSPEIHPGGRCEAFASTEDMGILLRFMGRGTGTLHVTERLWYPVGPLADSSWAYIPPGKQFYFSVDDDAQGTLMFEAVATVRQ